MVKHWGKPGQERVKRKKEKRKEKRETKGRKTETEGKKGENRGGHTYMGEVLNTQQHK